MKPLFLFLISAILLGGCIPNTNVPSGPCTVCNVSGDLLTCPRKTTAIFVDDERRVIHWQLPACNMPVGGFPVVLMFQGSLFSADLTWAASPTSNLAFGAYNQTLVVQKLLDNGFAVITPLTHNDGITFWDTNNPLIPDYEQSNDHKFMLKIFDMISNGAFGQLNPAKMYATGISSGGYMTSRMAISYPGKFRALAIAAASYANCVGVLCSVPGLPAYHPPTLFLHGGIDLITPLNSMLPYYNKLVQMGIPAKKVIQQDGGHMWINASPKEVYDWFNLYNQ